MNQYHKIQTVFLRNPDDNYKSLLEGQFAKPEFEYLKDNIWVWTEKIDGTNIRIIWNGNKVSIKGKTDRANIPQHLLYKLEKIFSSANLYNTFEDTEICLYGEGYGFKIQKGSNYIQNDVNFILFDVKVGDIWLKRDTVEDIGKSLGVDVVPIIGKGTLQEAIELTRKGFASTISQNKEYIAEGLICKPEVDLIDRGGNRVITKIKYKDFN